MHVATIGRVGSAGEIARRLARRAGLAWLDGDAPHRDGRASFVACDPVEVRRVSFGAERPLEALAGIEACGARVAGDSAGVGIDPSRAPRWIGYVAYDAAWSGATRVPARLTRDPAQPIVWMARYDAVAAIDHTRGGEVTIVGDDRDACARLAEKIERGGAQPVAARIGAPRAEPAEPHRRAILAALEHIAAGDIYQVNLAREWIAPFDGSSVVLFEAMRRASRVPLGFFVDAGDHAVLSRTMERFLAWEGPGGALSTRPIKGTIARPGDDDARDARALAADDKERAEHAMIVDLMRNDLGRVAEVGTVRVEEPMVVEPYARLSHLVSTVACRTRAGVDLAAVLEATFPPGSVTGAPKIRAIEIIEALERTPRGPYCGAMGYVDRAGGASFAVGIRTAVVRGGAVRYHAGGGLVSASDPDREIAETELKARVFFEALAELAAAPEAPSRAQCADAL